MPVLLRSEVENPPVSLQSMSKKAEQLLQSIDLSESELSILIVDDERMTELNAGYRQKESPTNVLSFPLLDDENEPGPVLLGDIVISIDTALRESEERNISIENYLDILLVHGLAHLLGHDHERSEQHAEEMASLEKQLLKKLHSICTNPLTT